MANVTVARQRKGDEPEGDYSVEVVTPDIARTWLGLNTHNRALSNATVNRYARDMKSGDFAYTGDPIRFNGKGNLIDGQHRLHGCVKADTPFKTLVVRGLALSVQERLDQGKGRSAGDHLHLRGVESAFSVAATARQLIGIKRGHVSGQSSGSRPTNAEVMAVVEKHPELPDSIGVWSKQALGVSPSLLGALHYIGAHLLKERETADAFVSVFVSGEPTYKGDAAHLWRERLVAQMTQKTYLRPSSKVIGTIHAWNHFSKQTSLQSFRMPDEWVAIEGLDVDRL